MVQVESRSRNAYVDQLRGLAMLMVVFGHTMTGCTSGSEETFIYNLIWSLQMPLFMMLSGYANRWSKSVDNWRSYRQLVKKRTTAYMLPWLMWTLVIRGGIFAEKNYLNIPWLLNHMDTGYWFLFSIWVISVIHGTAQFLAEKCTVIPFFQKSDRQEEGKLLLTTMFFGGGMAVVVSTGMLMGMAFLGTKLTLYYMPFYFVGYLYGKLAPKIECMAHAKGIVDAVAALCCAGYVAVLIRVNMYTVTDDLQGIAIRAMTSMLGCIALCNLGRRLVETKNSFGNLLAWIGQHTLEIYLLHYLLLCPIHIAENPSFAEPIGFLLAVGNFFLTMLLTVLSVQLLSSSRIVKKFLFGK